MIISEMPPVALQPSGVSPVHEFLRIVSRQRRLFLAVAVPVAAVVIGVSSMLPARYTASAVVSVVASTPDPLQPNAANGSVGDDDVATEAALLSARDLVSDVVKQTGFGVTSVASAAHVLLCRWAPSLKRCHPLPPNLDARIDTFIAQLNVVPEQHGRLIDLTFTDRNPAVAATALNSLVARFQQNQIAARTESLDRTSSWLAQRAEELRAKWIEASARAGAYRSKYGLSTGAEVGSDTPVTSQETVHVAGDYATAQGELAAAEARQTALHSQGAASVDDPVQAGLVAQLSQLPVEQAQLRAEHGDDYPTTASIDRQVAAAQAQLGAARARAVRAADTDVVAKRAALAGLEKNLSDLQGQAGTLGVHEVQLAQLENEARSAQTVYEEFLARTNELGERSALLQPSVQFAGHAVVPSAPSFPNRPRLVLAGIVLGLLAGIGAVLSREHLMRGFSNISRVGHDLAVPLLGTVPLISGRRDRRQLAKYVTEHPLSQAGEAMRGLAMQLQFAGEAAGHNAVRSLVVTSATGKEGKTTSCLWLATVLARSGQRVLLIDADHRRGTIAERLGGRSSRGTTELVAGTATVFDVVQRAEALDFDFIASGGPMSHPFGGAELRRLRDLVNSLSRDYDIVLIDTPPLLAMTDALAYANVADRTVVMCLWRSTTRQAVASSLARLEAAGARVLGVVLTMVDESRLQMFSDDLRVADRRLLAGYYTIQ
jgi:succinoglycan biosynthesis transport protein ExoP